MHEHTKKNGSQGLEMNLNSITGTFIVAELSANHNGSLQTAVKTIQEAARAGANAIKIQTYTADTLTIKCDSDIFRINSGSIWDGRTLYDLYQEAHTPWDWHPELKRVVEEEGLVFFSTPFDVTSADFLEELGVPIFKIASFEITDTPLIEYVAKKGKPMLISTGIADHYDIQLALDTCRASGNNDLVLLKCTSSYPAPIEDANLLMIPDMCKRYNVLAGLSDHTMGSIASIAAVALGAKVIEKHFILDRRMGGPDSSFSMEPEEFKNMVDSIRNVEKALGAVDYELNSRARQNRSFSRSLFIVRDVTQGELVTKDNVRSIRPGDGMHPKYLPELIGLRFKESYPKGTPLAWELVTS
jgi:pseudaminic acid synthase